MFTNKAIEELGLWAEAAAEGRAEAARGHLRNFYHVGAALFASKEFQSSWNKPGRASCEPAQLESVCRVLAVIAEIETNEVLALQAAQQRPRMQRAA
jgi:hypothetical protein